MYRLAVRGKRIEGTETRAGARGTAGGVCPDIFPVLHFRVPTFFLFFLPPVFLSPQVFFPDFLRFFGECTSFRATFLGRTFFGEGLARWLGSGRLWLLRDEEQSPHDESCGSSSAGFSEDVQAGRERP